ncbi:hypothetical protein [Acidocella sp.]|uniref:hypothetical protein n=1 Tax=Acidocella sp. TaxID=50710 RepID=UPI002624C2DB|nr:hypothetical protein [Acidocella sp.]
MSRFCLMAVLGAAPPSSAMKAITMMMMAEIIGTGERQEGYRRATPPPALGGGT